ncbi:MAG: hypothetical protein D6737_07960 [Chloroflexi bacterium]|nr:MAG: hypothetical protein D6737_07960 [Chloroflexota bacterium]
MAFIKQQGSRVGVLTLALLLTLAALNVGLVPDDPFEADAIDDAPFASLTYALHAGLWWDETRAAINLDLIQRMAFSHVKQIFAWEDIEPGRDLWNFERADEIVAEVERRDLELVIRLSDSPDWARRNTPGEKGVDFTDAPPDDYADFATYCGTIAERYRGRIDAYQIWNEPNLSREWGGRVPNAVEYVALLAACSEAIRAADPQAILISAGLAPTGNMDATAHRDDIYLQAMYDAGFTQYIDVVGMHAPGFSAPWYGPDEAERDGIGRWFTFRRVEDLRKIMIANGDAARQVAILEMGWTTDKQHPEYAWYAVDEQTQAQYLVAAYQYAVDHWRPWVGLMTTIYAADPLWTKDDEQFWWSIIRPNGNVRQAYIDLANMAKYCDDAVIPARAPDSPEALGLAPVHACG